ncbi:class I SAM-dependent methyltransferase [Aureimonas mangrovi]|uniref:class I SAM-dependent methyltransferase n=1 Tax=Aureimonas mangrovi TaxID=2758041 RepID=UPI00163D44BA|nr:class I SAM-dependent methyltransferase [Aureimonas mangrovi]
MDDEAYSQYEAESRNWLKFGRIKLLEALLSERVPGRAAEILDLGAGVGQNIPTLLKFGTVDALEIDEMGLRSLRKIARVRRIIDQPVPLELDQRYDLIVATDVLEHLPDDRAAARWIAEHLKEGGLFVSTVPAYQFLFSEHDVALHHFRRYTAKNYARIMVPEMRVVKAGYFNSVLFPVAALMRLSSRFLKKGNGEGGKARKQSGLMPGPVDRLFRKVLSAEVSMIDRNVGLPFGLSVYCVCQKA